MTNQDQFHKTFLLLGCVRVTFDNTTVTSINEFIVSAVGKIYKIQRKKLCELDALWLLKYLCTI